MTEVALLPMTAARSKPRARGASAPRAKPAGESPTWKLGDYIEAEMRARGITDQTELAAFMGVNQSSVSRWISGDSRGPSGDNMRRLSEFLRMPIQELYLIKHRNPGPISATVLEREVRRLEGQVAQQSDEISELNDQLRRIEARLDLLIQAKASTSAAKASRN